MEMETIAAIREEMAAADMRARAVLSNAMTLIELRLTKDQEEREREQQSTDAAIETLRNSVIDNATGVGGLIELARAFTRLPSPPKRSILFLFVTAEEQGLLGSSYYAEHPLYPLGRTLAVMNLDGLNVHGRTRDVSIVGLGLSSLDDSMQRAATSQGRVVTPDPMPEKGSYYRSDHFPFAQKGVPAIHAGGGVDYVGMPAGYGTRIREEYIANDYHKPSDRVKSDWDLGGAVEDLDLYLRVGLEVAQASTWPSWKPGAEFRGRRDEMLKSPR